MNTLDKLKMICNVIDSPLQNSPALHFTYIDFNSNPSEIKKENRNHVINEILDIEDVVDNDLLSNYRSSDPLVISPKIYSISLLRNKFNGYDTIYQDIINILDSSKNTSSNSNNLPNLDIDLSIWESGSANRRLLSRFMQASSFIAINGRISPAKTAILGKEVYDYVKSNNIDIDIEQTGLKILLDESIDIDKVILLRNNKYIIDIRKQIVGDSGINLILGDDCYYLGKTKQYELQCYSFRVTI